MEKITGNTYLGITLLFAEKRKSSLMGYAKSYVILADHLETETIKIVHNEMYQDNKLKKYFFIGIEELFYVSGKIKQYQVLGKSYYDEIQTLSAAHELANNSIKFKGQGYYYCDLVYFYSKKSDADKFAITAQTIIRAKSRKDLETKINNIATQKTFISKIVTKKRDKLDFKHLTFVGLKNALYSFDKIKAYHPFLVYEKKLDDINEIIDLIMPYKTLKKRHKFIMNNQEK